MLPLSLVAQNLNPEVQVTNAYETRINDVTKQAPSMTVPDSMLRFDYHFDYSVFDSPYKGAYEFSPYSVLVAPEAAGYDGRKFYLRAGAGWTMKPEAELDWSIFDGKKASLDLFGRGDGYWGRYRRILKNTFDVDGDVRDWGWDFRTVAGLSSRFDLANSELRAELAYDGIFTGLKGFQESVGHAPYARVQFSHLVYNDIAYTADVRYRFVRDMVLGLAPVQDHDVRADLSVLPYYNEELVMGADLLFTYNSWYLGLGFRPHAEFSLGNWDFDLGLRLGWWPQHFNISPDVKVVFHAFDGYLDIYANAVGQNYHLSYWDYKSFAHRFVNDSNYPDPAPVREIADLCLGFKGFSDFGLHYDLKAGYRFLENAPMWGIGADGGEAIILRDYNSLHADLDLAWSSKRLEIEGGCHYKWLPYGAGEGVFAPAAVTAGLKATYNYMNRIYVGIGADMSTDRVATVGGGQVVLPWYVDLGAKAEYRFNKHLGAWLKGGNLLNMDIRQSPMYSPLGPSVLAGITLSL